ncbi:MAG TPA: hypothetical protein VD970_12725 [Acetobacteraceae bacterium]|nr:hypothetical protein [Acetobacteraceae bacterium]
MQERQENGLEFLDQRLLSWEQRYALHRHAVAWAQQARAETIAGSLSWLGRAAARVIRRLVRVARRPAPRPASHHP